MRKNRLFILGIFTVMVALVSLSLVSGTWAKYTSTTSGSDTAKVAKWEWVLNGEDPVATATGIVDVFSTVYDTDGTTDETDVDGNLIAPGTSGSFQFELTNKSQVTGAYAIVLEETNTSNVPLQYSLNGTDWYDSIAELNAANATELANTLAIGALEKVVTVSWRWVFDNEESGDGHDGQTNGTDTTLGAWTTQPEVKINYTITLVQVD